MASLTRCTYDANGSLRLYADAVFDHQLGEALTVDQYEPHRNGGRPLDRSSAEATGGDEHARLGLAASIA